MIPVIVGQAQGAGGGRYSAPHAHTRVCLMRWASTQLAHYQVVTIPCGRGVTDYHICNCMSQAHEVHQLAQQRRPAVEQQLVRTSQHLASVIAVKGLGGRDLAAEHGQRQQTTGKQDVPDYSMYINMC